jgi:hypothetical protein
MTATLKHLCLLVALLTLGASAAAQSSGSSAPSAKSRPESVPEILANPMIFYLAKGEPDACGQGCSEWIAAEGAIDLGAPQRLRTFLARLGKRKLPIFFHSPGGLGGQAMAIGRLLREREMTAGVSLTVTTGCAETSNESCQALKRSGQGLAAELSNLAACNSGCVYALIGAKVRQVPPGARLGVHSGKPVVFHPDGRLKGTLEGSPSSRQTAQVNEFHSQVRRYLQEMRVSRGLLDVISKIPYEQVHFLSRDEISTFGIDAREFQETRWMVWKKNSAIKFVVEAGGANRKEFRTSYIRLSCSVRPRRTWVSYVRRLRADEMGATKSIKFVIEGRNLLFPLKGTQSKIDAIDSDGTFEARVASEPLEFFQAAAARDSIEIVESDPAALSLPPRTTRIAVAGLSKALDELKKNCVEADPIVDPGSDFNAPAVKFLEAPVPHNGDFRGRTRSATVVKRSRWNLQSCPILEMWQR